MSAAADIRGPTVLVVDDRPDNLFVLEQVLADGIPDARVIAATSAKQGLALAASTHIDAALIDVQMPGIDGIEMCRRLKASAETRSVHVIMLTAHDADAHMRVAALNAGAEDFLRKPIDNVELIARVNVMLRIRRAEADLETMNHNLELLVSQRTRALEAEVAEHKRADEALHRQAQIVSCSRDSLALVGRDYVYLAVNDVFCRHIGKTKAQVIGHRIAEFVGETHFEVEMRPHAERCMAGEVVRYNLWFDIPTVGRRHFELVYSPYVGPGGEILGYVASGHDTTEVTVATELLQTSSDVLEASPVLAFQWRIEAGWPVDYVSDNVGTVLGYSVADFRSGRVAYGDLIHSDDRERVAAETEAADTGRAVTHVVHAPYRIVTKGGESRWVEDRTAIIRDAAGRATHHRGVVHDITDRYLAERALIDGERRFRRLFEDVPVALWEEDFSEVRAYLQRLNLPATMELDDYIREHPHVGAACARAVRVVAVNKAALALHGATSIEHLERDISRTFTPQSHDVFRSLLANLWHGRPRRDAETQLKTLAEGTVQVVIRWSLPVGSEHTWNTVLVSMTDITERRVAEDALRASELRLTEVGRLAKVGGWHYDRVTAEVMWSPQNRRIHEVADDYVPSYEDVISFYHPDDRPRLREAGMRAAVHGVAYDLEARLITAKGTPLWVHVIGKPVVIDGEVVRLTGTIQDVTERKMAQLATRDVQEKLGESELRFRAVVEASTDGILVADVWTQEILYASKSLCAMLDCSALGGIGRTVSELHPAAAAAEVTAAFDAGRRGAGRIVQRELPCLRDDGEVVHADVSSDVFVLADRTCLVRFYRDVSDRRMATQMEHKASELEAFNESMVGREARIIELKEQVNRLALRLGEASPYPPVWTDDDAGSPAGASTDVPPRLDTDED